MKNIFDHHVREIHITDDRKLRLRVASIDQAIKVLELLNHGLDQVGPKNPELELDVEKQSAGNESRNCEKTVSKITISFVEKQKATHRDVYIIKVFPNIRDNTTVIINEDDIDNVKNRLVKLIKRFNQERARRTPIPTLTTTYPDGEARVDMFKTQAAIEHHILLDRMGSEAIHQQSQPGCEPKQRDIFNPGKKEE
jgi:hypothetical protein